MTRSILLGASLLLVATTALAQGSSPVKVTSVSVSPATFKGGDQVTITVALQNTSTNTYGCPGTPYNGVSVYVFKAEPYTTPNMVWQSAQLLPGVLAPGERKTVTLTTKWPVPNTDVPQWHVTAWGPVCAPDEFGQQAVLKIEKECVYRYAPRLQFIGRAPIKDLKILKP